MNDPSNRLNLGIDPEAKPFQGCNMELNGKMQLRGQGMQSSAGLIPDLVDEGVRLLVYAGNAGMRDFESLTARSYLLI